MQKLAFVSLIAFVACTTVACTTGGDDDGVLTDAGNIDAAFRDSGLGDGDVPADTCTDESRDSTLGDTCASDPDCDDGCYCNGLEACLDGICAASADPCTDEVECTQQMCLEDMNRCMTMLDHASCQDGDACNGDEVCAPTSEPGTGCVPGPEPECNDGTTCTYDTCEPAQGCVFTPRDLDMDGFIAGSCGGEDCDDDPRFGVDIYPGAIEICDNRRDDNCDGLRDYTDDTCIPTNDHCSSAVVIPGPGTYSGATRGLRGDFTTSCGPSGTTSRGPDAVFRFHLDEVQDVRINLAGGGFDPILAIREFDQCSSGPDQKCQWGSGASMLRRSLAPGDYAIIVKTSEEAVFDLVIRFGPPTEIPPVDLCNAETTDVSGGGSFDGFFEEVEDDYSLSCNHTGSSSRDVAHRFTITEPQDVTIDVTSSASQIFVALVTDCTEPSSAVRCVEGFESSTIRARGLAPGTYYILIEPGSPTATTWNMSVSITDPVPRVPGDACSTAIDITTTPGTIDLAAMENDGGNSCQSDPFVVDGFFYFDIPAGGADVTLTTTSSEPFGTWLGSSLSRECGSVGSEITCRNDSTPVTQRWLSLAEGRYFVTSATFSTFGTLTVTANITTPPTPIPPNDRCAPPPAGAGAIRLRNGVVERGTLLGFGDDTLGCGFSGQPDAFYAVHLTRRSIVTLVASPGAGFTGNVTLTVRANCTGTGSIGCGVGRPAAFSEELDIGDYIVIVEAESDFSAGDFTLTPIFTPI
jgi:hypothetical protein